jgi:uncharacterized protein YlxW (UPF0749 family)
MGLIFLLFGFMMTSQINTINKKVNSDYDKQSGEFLANHEQLKKQRDELQKKVDELTKKNEYFENAVTGTDDEVNLIQEELKKTRLIAGLSEVKGKGIIIEITPKKNLLRNSFKDKPIIDLDLLTIVNKLREASAEAISINDIRIVGTSGIRTADYSIIIDNQRVSPYKSVTIKAIGNKSNLEGIMKLSETITDGLSRNCDITIKTSDEIVIQKRLIKLKCEYARQANE